MMPTDAVIFLRPDLCKNRNCNRPIHTRQIAAWVASDPNRRHPDPTHCLQCLSDWQAKVRNDIIHGGETIPVDDGGFYDEDRTCWPKGSY